MARAAAAEGLERADYAGHSLGGLVAVRLAIRQPDAVRRWSSRRRRASRRAPLGGARARVRGLGPAGPADLAVLAAGRAAAAARAAVFGHWFAADPQALSPQAVAATLAHVNLHADTDSAWRALIRDDPRPDLHLVKSPALLLWGSSDNQLPFDDAVDYARRLRAPLRVVADCGHLLVLERPDACLDAIDGFLSAADARYPVLSPGCGAAW